MQFFECDKIYKTYARKTVLDNISLSVDKHEIISIIGPSGSGKTTLLRCIAGLDRVNRGRLFLNGQDITWQKAELRPIVMMFQQPLLFPHMTVYDNIVYGLKARGEKKEDILKAGREMLSKIEMEASAQSYPFELSGGQQQRVALARALIMKPQVLLLDEPFASLDPELRFSIRSWVRRVLKEEGVTTLFVTHDKEEAMIMGDRIAVMTQGIINQVGHPIEVYRHPANQVVAKFFSDGMIIDNKGFVAVNKINVKPRLPGKPETDQDCQYYGIVRDKWVKSGFFMYRVEVPAQEAEVSLAANYDFDLGDPVTVLFNSVDIHYLEG